MIYNGSVSHDFDFVLAQIQARMPFDMSSQCAPEGGGKRKSSDGVVPGRFQFQVQLQAQTFSS